MKTIGIKLADGSFYPVLEEGSAQSKKLELTTANNNQTKVMVDLYRSANCTMEDAEYVESLQIENLIEHPNGEATIAFNVSLNEDNELEAEIIDEETGNSSVADKISLVSRTQEERALTDEFNIADESSALLNNDDDIFSTDGLDLQEDTQAATADETVAADETFTFDENPAANETTAAAETPAPEENDDFFNMDNEPLPSAGISFTGLYDKETEEGKSEPEFENETERKTKVPVIICIICAIICILAVILIFFVLPTRCNLLSKKTAEKAATVEESPLVTEESLEEPEEVIVETVPAAKEDEIVIIEEAEKVIPEAPQPAEEKQKESIYKIKWGDTLWDIAGTYYKNPWKYKYLAEYNGIKNPDYIISGTEIIIPAE